MPVDLTKNPLTVNDAARASVCRQALLNMAPRVELNFAMMPGEYADHNRCLGHESLAGSHMGESVYCDGSCTPGSWTPLIRI